LPAINADDWLTADIDKEVARGEKPRHDLRQPRSEERWRYTWTRGSAAATRRHRIPTGTAGYAGPAAMVLPH